MKRRIYLSLIIVLVFFTLGTSYATIYIRNTTKALTDLITMHQVEDMRQYLIISIQTAQSDIYTVHTSLGRNIDRMMDNVGQLDQTARMCSSCHHSPEIERQIEGMQSMIIDYKNALSNYITASLNTKQSNKLKFNAAAIGKSLLIKTEGMSLKASGTLEAKIRHTMEQIKRVWMTVAATVITMFFFGIIGAIRVASSIAHPIETLVKATHMLEGGDLGHTIDYQDKTEFGELAAHFNKMSLSLKDSYAKLEKEIMERRRAEEALRASEMKFRILFEQAAAGVAQIETATGRFVKINRRFCEIVGYSEDEIMGMTFQHITHPDDLERDLDKMQRLRLGEIPDFSIEKRYIRKNGEIIWASIAVSPMWLPGEQPRYNIGVVLDITERKRIEVELNKSHARYQQLFETAPVSTMEEDYSRVITALTELKAGGVVDVESYLKNNQNVLKEIESHVRVTRVNQSALRLFGARDKTELLTSLDRTMQIESLDACCERLVAFAEGKTSFRKETVRCTLDGRRIDVIQIDQVVGDSSRMNQVIESHIDITALKLAERALRRSNDFITTVMNSIDPAIVLIDVVNNAILACNSSFLHETSLAVEDVVGKSWRKVVCRSTGHECDLKRSECALMETLRTGNQAVCELVRLDGTGAARHIEVRTFPVKDDEGRIIQIIHLAEDITLHKQAEEARLKEQELRRISAERQVVETQLRMLQAQIEPHFLFNTLAHIITLIPREPGNATKMLQYLTETLRVSLLRTRQGTSTLGQEMDLLRDFLSIYGMRMGKRLRFTINVSEELLTLPLPPLLLQPLVENAVKHGIEPSAKGGNITISAERTADVISLKVSDTGKGFSENATADGVGLTNVRERLDALYGSKGRLILSENTPCGFTATIEVPYESARINC